jgi:hypothetical protein
MDRIEREKLAVVLDKVLDRLDAMEESKAKDRGDLTALRDGMHAVNNHLAGLVINQGLDSKELIRVHTRIDKLIVRINETVLKEYIDAG